MWTNNTRNAKIKGDQIEVFKILNGYENIDSNITGMDKTSLYTSSGTLFVRESLTQSTSRRT